MEPEKEKKEDGLLTKELKAEIEGTVVDIIDPMLKDFKDKIITLNFQPAPTDWKVEMGEQLRKVLSKEVEAIVTHSKAITTTTMDAIIPEEWIAHIYATLPMYGAAFASGLQKMPLAEVINMAKLGTDMTLEYQTTENVAPTDSAPTVTAKSVDRATLIGTLRMAKQSLEYSAVDLTNFFTQRFILKYAYKIDGEVFVGDAGGGVAGYAFTGITNATGTNSTTFAAGETSFDNISRDYLIKAIGSVNSNHLNGACWFCSNSVRALIHRKCTSTTGQPLFDFKSKELLGFPLHITASLPAESASASDTAFIIFGSVRDGIAFGENGFEVASSSEYGFATNSIWLRAVGDIASYVILPELFAVIKTHA